MGLIETQDLKDLKTRVRERGAAMVEMVFLLPVICLLIFAIAEFGIAFGQWQTLNNAVREGARFAILYRGTCDPGTVQAAVVQKVDDYASAMGGIAPGDVSVTVNAADVCAGAGTPVPVSATLVYNFAILPNFSSTWFGSNVSSSITLNASSTMRKEG